mgnify:CR=1 FL=1
MILTIAENLCNALLIVPVVAFFVILILGRKHNLKAENQISSFSYLTAWTLVICSTALASLWLMQGKTEHVLIHGSVSEVDSVTIGFLLLTSYALTVTMKFSRYYLHREAGYSRFFSIVFLFIFGMNYLSLSKSLQDFLIGWEVIGLSSFLLISFYYQRELPVRHAMRAFAIYRITDAALLLAAVWLHSVEESSHAELTLSILGSSLAGDPLVGLNLFSSISIGLLLLIAAAGKGAQWPFSSWLPRAMEGPTPSSAIFYGALSIHAGILLLLRTRSLWLAHDEVRWVMGGLGLISALVATGVGRTQANIKGQIAYASMTQVGIMLVELALGWPRMIVLLHVVANATLRTYQLLASPSVVAHLLQMQTSRAAAGHRWSVESWLPKRLALSLYAFALNEGFLDYNPRYIGPRRWWNSLGLLWRSLLAVGVGVGILTVIYESLYDAAVIDRVEASFLTLVLLLGALAARQLSFTSTLRWVLVSASQVSFGILTIVLVHPTKQTAGLYFLSGIVPAAIIGAIMVDRLQSAVAKGLRDDGVLFPNRVLALLLVTLALSAFPVTQACWGEEMLLGELWLRMPILTAISIVTLVINGFTLMQIFAQECFGRKLVPNQQVV